MRRRAPTVAVVALAVMFVVHADPAFAQGDPFATARTKAGEIQAGLQRLASAVGMVGITICLMLGYFNKLSWKWLATGIGVSFALNVVPGFVRALASMAGG
jgi:type IV secretory pathway VirB2 component (pilin)